VGEPNTRVSTRGDADSPQRPRNDEVVLQARLPERTLARLIDAAIGGAELLSIAPTLSLNPLPGKRFKTMTRFDHALLVARTLTSKHPRALLALAQFAGRLPEPFAADEAVLELERAKALTPSDPLEPRLRAIVTLLHARDAASQECVRTMLESGFLDAAPPPAATADVAAEAPPPRDPEVLALEARIARLEAERSHAEAREKGFRARLEAAQLEHADLTQRIGRKHREYEELAARYEQAKSDNELAFRRAARFKAQLDELKAPSDREQELRDALLKERQRAEIEASKVEILEYMLDAAQHEDEHDPTPQNRESDPTPSLVAQFVARTGQRPRVLVVGGAGKQRSHRERDFEAFKDRVGFIGEWRFADYGSWHRELPRLRNDIRERFDLVFVLHWNRTTFVQKMHDEARALNGRVRTVPYRGFLSLERAVLDELARFIREKL
jgi:hypothetical protein